MSRHPHFSQLPPALTHLSLVFNQFSGTPDFLGFHQPSKLSTWAITTSRAPRIFPSYLQHSLDSICRQTNYQAVSTSLLCPRTWRNFFLVTTCLQVSRFHQTPPAGGFPSTLTSNAIHGLCPSPRNPDGLPLICVNVIVFICCQECSL
jgi:hypothetical protein